MQQDPTLTLIRMANQIAENHRHHGCEIEAAEQVATHLQKFWARPMKQRIIGCLATDGTELDPIARLAVERLASRAPAP